MLDVEREGWEQTIQVNLLGVQDLTRSLDSIIGGENHTRITTISSGAAQRSLHGWSAYCVSKAGLDMWTKCMAEEGENGIFLLWQSHPVLLIQECKKKSESR